MGGGLQGARGGPAVDPHPQGRHRGADRRVPAGGKAVLDVSDLRPSGRDHVRDATMAQMLAHLHVWSDEAIAKRYAYRRPGVDVLSLRVHRMLTPIEIAETAEHIGCKSWVALDRG